MSKHKSIIRTIQILCLFALSLPTTGYAAIESPIITADVDLSGAAAQQYTANVVTVTTNTELSSAINNATAGTTILLADGIYSQNSSFAITDKNGTETNPITIKAANQGQAILTGRAGFSINNSSNVVIQGMKFTGTATAVNMNNSNHVRVTRNTFELADSGNPSGIKWIQFGGSKSHHNRIDHNDFGPRVDLGQMIAFQGNVMSQYDVIEYNYFHDAASQPQNGGETIRVGLSGSSMSSGFTTIQCNLFVNLDSDPEVISVKSGQNTVRYNTFINNKGQVTARHGHGNSYYGNYFYKTIDKDGVGGFRIYGNDHKIYNNYLENIPGAIHIDGGDYDAGPDGSQYDSTVLTKHWRVYRAQVFNNTIVGSSSGIVVSKSYTYTPVDSIVANNIVTGADGPLYNEMKATNTVFEGNIGFGGALSNMTRSTSEMKEADPLHTVVAGVYKLSSVSPAIDAAVGSYPIVDDIDGQPRTNNDVGADEYHSGLPYRQPLTPAEVGPNALTGMQAQVEGTKWGTGWFSSDVRVKLGALNVEEGAGHIEYRLNSNTVWQAIYAGIINLSAEGTHTIRYRYVLEGADEPEKLLEVKIDKTSPEYQLLVNGAPLVDQAAFSDSETLTLKLEAQDDISGLDRAAFTVSGATYDSQTDLPLAGKLGEQQIIVRVVDNAGNTREFTHRILVTPTLERLFLMIQQYNVSGDIRGPLEVQISNRIKQALHHYHKGESSSEQTVKFLVKIAQDLQDTSKESYITSEAMNSLTVYTEALIAHMNQ